MVRKRSRVQVPAPALCGVKVQTRKRIPKRTDRKLGKKKEKSNCAAEAVHIQKKNYITTQKVSWQKNILIGPSRT